VAGGLRTSGGEAPTGSIGLDGLRIGEQRDPEGWFGSRVLGSASSEIPTGSIGLDGLRIGEQRDPAGVEWLEDLRTSERRHPERCT
jgi:hypothetical protein